MKYDKDLYVQGVKIPRLMLGTSPFLGAGQFGRRADALPSEWQRQLENREYISDLAHRLWRATSTGEGSCGITALQSFLLRNSSTSLASFSFSSSVRVRLLSNLWT